MRTFDIVFYNARTQLNSSKISLLHNNSIEKFRRGHISPVFNSFSSLTVQQNNVFCYDTIHVILKYRFHLAFHSSRLILLLLKDYNMCGTTLLVRQPKMLNLYSGPLLSLTLYIFNE